MESRSDVSDAISPFICHQVAPAGNSSANQLLYCINAIVSPNFQQIKTRQVILLGCSLVREFMAQNSRERSISLVLPFLTSSLASRQIRLPSHHTSPSRMLLTFPRQRGLVISDCTYRLLLSILGDVFERTRVSTMTTPNVKSKAAAYISSPPVFVSRTSFIQRTQWKPLVKRMRRPSYVRACIRTDDTKAGSGSESSADSSAVQAPDRKSKTEEMVELLGQNKAELEEKAAEIKAAAAADNRKKYGLALASAVISTLLFVSQKLDPTAGVNLMHFLTDTSAPIELIGQNGKPTMIEFSATWCENCKYMARRVFELENEYVGRVNFVVIDGEDPSRQEIVDRYGVDAIPQFSMVTKDGQVSVNLIGLVPKQALASDLEALLNGDTLPFKGLSLEALTGPSS